MIEKIYIARHGFRLNWISSTWQSPTGLARDPPLTAYGETQAQELAQYFLSCPDHERPTAIFSSPYYRCLQTSQPLAKALGLPIYVEHGIAEWYSPVTPGTGLHPRPGSTESLQSFFPEVDSSWQTLYYPTRKGETVEEVHDRTDTFASAFVDAIAQRLPAEKQKRILLVTHAATVIALARTFIGEREVPMKAGCCSLTELERRRGENGAHRILGGFKPVMLVSGQHLKGGSSREWGFEDIEVEKGRVVDDPGVPGSENEKDEPVGLQSNHSTVSNL
ncbi:phosphoglycerate mutase-like protein [Panaeolus papilionaceus]|nr:phosphoglycerate mutase-like protein [Panaeolus papilionaceus]